MTSALHVDLYQLSSLVVHHQSGRSDMPVTMSFFSRRLPRSEDGSARPVRGFLLQAALARCLSWLAEARFEEEHLQTLQRHPLLKGRLDADLLEKLRHWKFSGIIDAPLDGTPLFAGRALTMEGVPVDIAGVRPSGWCPYLVVQTDLLSAKLIETPLLSLINHMTMVASKAATLVAVAGARAVYEFGSRRTHPEAAIDAALAAWIAGCAATSNVEAHHRYGIPCVGTMDHFAIQAWESPELPRAQTEHDFFKAFYQTFGGGSLLVDTYDTFGAQTGIRNAVRAAGSQLTGIRMDSGITHQSVWEARRLLDSLGAPQAKILLSGGMDEKSIVELGDAPADAFGIGERIVTSPDAPVGVGAVAKLGMINGRPTMKLSRGSGKATLPGRLQVFRTDEGDIVGLAGEFFPGRPLLERVWEGEFCCIDTDLLAARQRAQHELATLPAAFKEPRDASLRLSPALVALITKLCSSGG